MKSNARLTLYKLLSLNYGYQAEHQDIIKVGEKADVFCQYKHP